ncbi:lasso RiPP family leader peptide-containing protein [Streptomyces caatingaensis]|nr:lasso RiPP family leader peptide-containing protein [Streptomyces caatingaensis]
MSDPMAVEALDVYEPPLLAEAGDYTELTQGFGYFACEGEYGYFGY